MSLSLQPGQEVAVLVKVPGSTTPKPIHVQVDNIFWEDQTFLGIWSILFQGKKIDQRKTFSFKQVCNH